MVNGGEDCEICVNYTMVSWGLFMTNVGEERLISGCSTVENS